VIHTEFVAGENVDITVAAKAAARKTNRYSPC